MKEKYSLSKSNIIFFSVIFFIHFLFFILYAKKTPYQAGEFIGNIFVLFLFSILPAWIVWRRSRKKRKASIAFNIALSIFLIIKIVNLVEKSSKRIELQKLHSETKKYKKNLKNAFAEPSKIDSLTDDYYDKITKFYNKLANESTGTEAFIYKSMNEFMRDSQAVSKKWEKAINKVSNSDILKYSLLKSKEEINRQKQIINQYITESKKYLKYRSDIMDFLKKKLKPISFDKNYYQNTIKVANEELEKQKPIIDPLIKTHIEYGKIMIEILDVLERENSNWHTENNELIFKEDKTNDEFNQIINKAIELEEKINILSQKTITLF